MINALREYFGWAKGNWGIADFLAQCLEDEIPHWMRETCIAIAAHAQPEPGNDAEAQQGDAGEEAPAQPIAEASPEGEASGGV